MNYSIRNATILDLEEIYNLQNDYTHKLISKECLKDDLNNNSCIYFVCIKDDEILGVLGASCLVDHIDISIVISKKQYVKKGIASALLKELIHYSKDNNIENIFLEVRKSNISAINLYEKFGFAKISARKNYYADNEDALIYMLKL